MDEAITHFKVPIEDGDRSACLGPDGSVAHVGRVFRMLSGRWKLPILFRLFAERSMRSSQLLRDMPGVSQKMLTQHLRELEDDGLVERRDFGEQPPRARHAVLTHPVACRPCDHQVCPIGSPCLLGVSVEQVIAAATALLRRAPADPSPAQGSAASGTLARRCSDGNSGRPLADL